MAHFIQSLYDANTFWTFQAFLVRVLAQIELAQKSHLISSLVNLRGKRQDTGADISPASYI